MIPSNVAGVNAALQVVVVHGMVSPDGRLDETEVLTRTDATLNDAAVNRASVAHFLQTGRDTQPGTTPISREAISTVESLPRTPCADEPSAEPPALLNNRVRSRLRTAVTCRITQCATRNCV